MKWFFLLLLTPLCFADDKPLTGVQVSGTCEVKVTPDRGSVSFSAENQFKNQEEAVKKTNQQMNDLKAKIQELKLANVEFKTTNYTVAPVREWEKDRLVDKGTRATMTLEVTTSEIPRLGEAMVEASKVGIQSVGSMTTFLSVEKSQAEYLTCLDIASHDARRKADQLAKKLGFKVGDVLNVVESPLPPREPVPYPAQRSLMAKGMNEATPVSVDAGTQSFTTNIQVTYQIK